MKLPLKFLIPVAVIPTVVVANILLPWVQFAHATIKCASNPIKCVASVSKAAISTAKATFEPKPKPVTKPEVQSVNQADTITQGDGLVPCKIEGIGKGLCSLDEISSDPALKEIK